MDRITERVPPHLFFFISAIFHYLGPAFAVLLFARLTVLGVMWLRIASAAVVFAAWRRPWRVFASQRGVLLAFGIVLGLMNSCFYEAIARLPLSTVAAIEFVGPVILAAFGARTPRNAAALLLAVAGGWMLTHAHFAGAPIGYLFAFANGALFVLYIVLGHRLAANGANAGIDRLGAAMVIAALATLPIGFREALPAFTRPLLLLAGIGVGISSSVIPYICDQLAMARLPRASFALLLSLLPASSALIGLVVLRQVPSIGDVVAIALVAIGVALHSPASAIEASPAFEIVAHLADDIGARPAGSRNAALAVEWTTDTFRRWNVDVRNERVVVPHWVRGAESATVVSHNDQPLVLTTLGGSVATSRDGITAEVIEIRSFDDLDARVGGKIAFFSEAIDMSRVHAGDALEAYGHAVRFRIDGPSRAAGCGAVAVLIRSAGTASLRTPHTGSIRYDAAVPKIPAAALAAEDASFLRRLLARGDRVAVHLVLRPELLPDVESANVIAEIRGGERPDEIVLLGAHLDSWDLGTGAIDNATGVAMVMETMRRIHAPKRTVRCVLFMNEELGQSGSRAYFAAHGHETHVAAIECDLGAAAPRGFSTTLRGRELAMMKMRIAPMRLHPCTSTGVDTRPLTSAGVPGFGYAPDMRHYFDFHHSAADTLDKVDPAELEKGVAAVAALTRTLASR